MAVTLFADYNQTEVRFVIPAAAAIRPRYSNRRRTYLIRKVTIQIAVGFPVGYFPHDPLKSFDSSFGLLLILDNYLFSCKACAKHKSNAGTMHPRHLPTSASRPPLDLLFLAHVGGSTRQFSTTTVITLFNPNGKSDCL